MQRHFVQIITLAALVFAQQAAAQTARYEFDASKDAPGDATWDNTGGYVYETMTFDANSTPVSVCDPTLTTITSAYEPYAAGRSNAYEQDNPQISRRDGSFEVWFSPASLSGVQILVETGGSGRGTILGLNGDDLVFFANGVANSELVADTALVAGQWYHVVGLIHNAGGNDGLANDYLELYLDGVQVGDNAGAPVQLDDWCGGNQGAIGGSGGASFPAGSTIFDTLSGSPADYFDGQIAVYRYYPVLLDATQIAALADRGPLADEWTDLAADHQWSSAANWSAGAPSFIDSLLFFNTPGSTTAVNDAAGASLSGIIFCSDASGLTLSGNSFNLTGSLNNRSAAAQTITNAINMSGPVDLLAGSGINLSGVLSGSGTLTSASGVAKLSAANNYSGETVVGNGVLQIENAAALGSIATGTQILNASGYLELAAPGGLTLAEPLTIAGSDPTNVAVSATTGTNEITGAIAILNDQDNAVFEVQAGAALELSGDVDPTQNPGASQLTFIGDGDATFSGQVLETIDTTTDIAKTAGTSTLTIAGADKQSTGAIEVAAGTLAMTSASSSNLAPLASQFSARAGGTLDVSGLNGGLTLTEGQILSCDTDSVVVGAVTTADETVLMPGGLFGYGAAVMTLDGGLTLADGTQIVVALSDPNAAFDPNNVVNDQIVVANGVLTGPASGTVTLSPANVTVPGLPGRYTLIDFSAASGTSNLDVSDFAFEGFPNGTTVEITATSVDIIVTALPVVGATLVSDLLNNRIMQYTVNEAGGWEPDLDGTIDNDGMFLPFTAVFPSSVGNLPMDSPAGMAIGDDGTVYFAERVQYGRIIAIPPNYPTDSAQTIGEDESLDPGNIPCFNGLPAYMTVGPDDAVYFSVDGESGASPFECFSGAPLGNAIYRVDVSVNPPTISVFVPTTDGVNYTLSAPRGLAFGPDGDLYVADNGNGVVRRFDSSGAWLGSLTNEVANTEDGFAWPNALTWDSFNERLLLTLHDATDIWAFTDLSRSDLDPNDPTIEQPMTAPFNPEYDDADFIFGYLYHLNRNQPNVFRVEHPVVGGNVFNPAAIFPASDFDDPFNILVLDELSIYDLDNDGDVDMTDADLAFECLNGPDNGRPAACDFFDFLRLDFDKDGDFDLVDYQLLNRKFGN